MAIDVVGERERGDVGLQAVDDRSGPACPSRHGSCWKVTSLPVFCFQ
jgi:hypothetical protein